VVFDEVDFKYEQIACRNNIFSDVPLAVTQAENEKLQKLFFGYNFKDNLNYERLKEFSNINSNRDYCLSEIPHPLN